VRTRRSFGIVVAVAVMTATAWTVTAGSASAVVNPTITVTTAADEVDGSDSVLSLREAVALANATPGADTIQLADGETYDLTICGGSLATPDNSAGDLDATDAGGITIGGDPVAVTAPTIHQTCPQRVIWGAAGLLALGHVDLTGGTSVDGGSIRATGPLTLDHVDESGATNGVSSGNDDGAVSSHSNPVSIVDSTVHDNIATGIYLGGVGTTANSVIRRTSVADNVSRGVGGGIYSPTPFTLDQSEVTGNSGGALAAGVASFGANISASMISGNHDGRSGGVAGSFTLIDSRLIDNSGSVYGGALGSFSVTRSTVDGNHAGEMGGGLTGGGSVTDSTVSGNQSDGFGGGIVAFATVDAPAGPTLTLRRSTVVGNTGAGGGVVAVDDWADNNSALAQTASHSPLSVVNHSPTVVLDSSTVAGNLWVPVVPPAASYVGPSATDVAFMRWTGEPASVAPGSLTMTASVLGSGASANPACALASASVTSGGYNFGADGSCGIVAGVGDVAGGGDPGLSGLGDHGGPTLTVVPTVGSPLIDKIPAAFATCVAQHDQRGVVRPVGPACDVGSVEADAAVFPAEREFTPVVPLRLMDTRTDPAFHVGPQHRLGPNESQDLVVAGGASSPVPVDATAVVVNVTAVGPTDGSHVDVWPTGTSRPNVSNLNFVAGQTVPNLVKVKVGAGGQISLFNRNGSVDVLVDVVGYYRSEPAAARYTPIVPNRVVDTRADPTYHVGPLSRLGDRTDPQSLTVRGGSTGVPVDATAIIANVTVVDPTAASHLDLWPDGSAHPNGSNLNYVPGQTVANLVVVKVSAGGKIDLVNQNGSVDVIVDIVGYFKVDLAASGFVAVSPYRSTDTRTDSHVGTLARFGDHTDTRSVVVTGGTVPIGATAIVVNVTAVNPSTASHLDVWPAGAVKPVGSNINYTTGQTVPNLVTVGIGPGGAIDLQNQNGSTDVVIDIVGYYR
jgi:CSLREA domain-containing protein